METGYRFALALSAAFVLLAYKGIAIGPLAPGPVLLGWLLESALLSSLWALASLAARSGRRPLALLGAVLFYVTLEVLLLTSLSHTIFFESAAERRFSLLELDLAMLVFFFKSVLPVRGLLLLGALWLAPHLLALFAKRALRPVAPRPALLAIAGAWVVLSVVLWRVPRVPSPLADMASSSWESLTTPELHVDRSKPARFDPAHLDKSAARATAPFAYDKVLVFVMETMTADTVARERKALPAHTYVNRLDAEALRYTRYFATNQDSRTGMLSMLGSRFIPYESYTEEGRDAYLKLAERSSLVDLFKQRGYHSAFVVSQQELELVVADLPWDERVHLEEGDVDVHAGKFLCFVPYEFEHSCEDRALLPRMLDVIDQHERVFVYQEFIWGHAAEYNKASGKTNTEYYSAYIDEVVAHLKRRGVLDRTLIVLTSDHGFRDKGLQSQRDVYQLPLSFHAPGLAPRRDDGLFSHLDFKDLLLAALSPSAVAPPAPSPYVMVVGPTGTGFLAVVTEPGAFLLLKSREGRHTLVRADGLPAGERAEAMGADFLRLFDDYLARFARL
ncbi:MAG: sulfatase-like hydrolase/transferase [Polyangiales bacterium]